MPSLILTPSFLFFPLFDPQRCGAVAFERPEQDALRVRMLGKKKEKKEKKQRERAAPICCTTPTCIYSRRQINCVQTFRKRRPRLRLTFVFM